LPECLAAEPGHAARRGDPRDEPGRRFGRQHRPDGRGELTAAPSGAGAEVVAAIGAYEAKMRDHAFAAVEASRR
jgi:hypothetical protein